MRKKVRKSLAFLLALALVVSVMSGLGLSVSADDAQNEPVVTETEGEPAEEKPKVEESTPKEGEEEEEADPDAEAVPEEKKDVKKVEGEGSGEKAAENKAAETPKAGENVQTATIGTGDKTVTVKTTAAAGVLPEGAKLVVKKLANQEQAYQDAESTLRDSQVTYDDFLALDVGFEVNGKEVEPEAGSVQVQFELGAGLLPENADTNTLAVQHLTDGKAETVADVGAVTTGDVTVKNEVVKADFEVKSFSTFTITWGEYWTITAHYVDESDKEINPSTVDQEISFYHYGQEYTGEKNITFETDSNYALVFAGYKYKEAYIKVNGEKKRVTRMTIKLSSYYGNEARTVTFYDDNTPVKTQTYSRSKITDDLYLVYAADATIGGPGGSITDQKKLSHDKYVEAKTDGTYDLSLTVSGAKGSKTDKAKLDILLIVDRSGSMARQLENEYDGDSRDKNRRIDKVADAVKSLTSALDTKKETLDVKYSVITFAGDDGTNAARKDIDWTDSASNVNTTIGEIEPYGGTNYQAGIRMAKTQLNQARPDAQKVVIFLTDGQPTYYIGGGNGREYGPGSDTTGSAKNAKKEISNMWTDYFYCVGAGPAFKDDNTTNQTAYQNLVGLKDSVHATNKGVYRATSTAELNKIFTDMSANITNLYCDHVTITDELSDNVQLVESASGTPKDLFVTVKKGDKDGTVEITGNNEVLFQQARIWAEYKDGKILLHFPENYTLDPEYTYIVTANIEATETAYQRVRDNGGNYPNKGGKGTGTTSEDAMGVFTNKKAEVTYTYNEVKTTEGYNNPVIQPKPAKLTVKKTITGLTEEEINSALKEKLTFDITYTYPTSATEDAKTKTDQVTLGTVTKNDDGTYTYTYTNDKVWSMSAKYSVKESKYNVDNYDCAVTPADATQTGSIPKYGEATATFTNAYTPSNRTITLKKVVAGNMGDTKQEFQFRVHGTNVKIEGNGKLKHKDTTTITAKVGDRVSIWEDKYDGYTTTATATKDVTDGTYSEANHSYTFTVTKEMNVNTIITFTNDKTIQPPNGITTTIAPYAIMVVLAAGAGVYFVYSRRRRNG